MNGDARSVRAYLEATISPSICKIADVKAVGNQIVVKINKAHPFFEVLYAPLHARGATRIEVRVAGEHDYVRLTVNDDGEIGTPRPASATGYGLAGMRERATLLGGTLTAGPGREAGWTVVAALPRDGAAR